MDFRILGSFEVLDHGGSVALGGVRQRALLALLALHVNETLGVERLVDELWGERAPATATKTVQVNISRLRRALERSGGQGRSEVIVTRDHGYELRVDPGQVDACRFERLIVEGRRELAAGRPGRAGSLLEEALGLWRGPPLAEFVCERFAQDESARLDELRVGALEELIEAKLALRRHSEVVGELERLIREHPYRERLRAQLMLALYRCDRQAEALQAYRDARRILGEELGIEPSQRLRELERAILAQDQKLAMPDHAVAGAPVEPVLASGAVFVGRQRELAELVASLDEACAGHGRLCLLIGEPGIGKSRLAEELVGDARARGARVLLGRCWEAGGAPAYWPWVQALRSYLRETDGGQLATQLGPAATDLALLLPELYELLPGLPPPIATESEAARFRLFHATVEFLRRASSSCPIVLGLDDLHAADTPSLLLLQFLARELAGMRVLVIGALRDVDPVPGEPLTAMLAEVAREPVTRRLPLAGLSEQNVAEYVRLTGAGIGSPELAADLYAETEGNPLFVAETVRLLALEAVPSEPGGAVSVAIPQSMRDVISRRLAHLSPECRQALVLASVLGREFALEPLAYVAGTTVDALLETLDEAMAARVIGEAPGTTGQLRFAHVVIRDTIYDALTATRRVRLHRLVIETLEALHGDDPDGHLAELAHHAIAGSEFEKGYNYARRAGDRELTRFGFEESARLYQIALDALEIVAPSAEQDRCRLLLSLGEAQARAGDTPAAQNTSLEAAGLARRLRLGRELGRAAACYGGRVAWVRAGRDHQLVPLLEEGLTGLGDQDIELRSRLLARLAGALRDEHSRDRRDALSGEAVELARQSGNYNALAFAIDGRILGLIAPDTITECITLSAELREIHRRIADREGLVQAHLGRFQAQIIVGDIVAAQTDLEAMVRIANELRQPAQLWLCNINRALLALAAGRINEAARENESAITVGERAVGDTAIAGHRGLASAIYDARGMLEDAETVIRDLPDRFPERPVFRCLHAYTHARLGRTKDAQRALDDLVSHDSDPLPFDIEWLYAMSLLAETCTLLHDKAAAAVLYPRLLPYGELNAFDPPEGARGSVARYLGLLARTLGRDDEAAAHFRQAITINKQMGARLWLAHAQRDYAHMLASNRPGDRERALALIDDTIIIYCELGLDCWAAEAGQLEALRSAPTAGQ
jgi:DNA-binding SARP family transcriptional activator